MADHLGLTLPSTSKLVQKLVSQKAISRREAVDRRRVCLSLTPSGKDMLAKARLETQQQLAEILGSLTQEELSSLSAALRILSRVFVGGRSDGNIL